MLSEISWSLTRRRYAERVTSAPGVLFALPESGRTPTAYETPRERALCCVGVERGRRGVVAGPGDWRGGGRGAHRRLVVIVVAHELGADERPRVVLAQVEVTQFGQVVAERLVHLLADAGHR